jgi:broad specificity phosphatase PhoE
VTTTFFLVRHAAHDNVGAYLAGRACDVSLGPDGRAQAERLARRMRREKFGAIHASPRNRTRETADAIAAASGLRNEVAPDLDEIDFGDEWCGRSFDELNADPAWRHWNEDRAGARTPAGEALCDVEDRVQRHVRRAAADHPDGAVVLVTHADVIKAAVTRHLGLPIAAIDRFEVAPASITTLVVGDWGAKLLSLNEAPSGEEASQ